MTEWECKGRVVEAANPDEEHPRYVIFMVVAKTEASATAAFERGKRYWLAKEGIVGRIDTISISLWQRTDDIRVIFDDPIIRAMQHS